MTEIYFIHKGEWAIGYNSYMPYLNQHSFDVLEEDAKGPEDLLEKGILIAQRRINFGYIGDYYVLASKRSQFYYVAIKNTVEAYALTKQFMFKTIFKKFPGLHSEMLAESFSRYLKEFRKPCAKKRNDTISKKNKMSKYSKISADHSKHESKSK